jgi:hypothetical protein
MDPVRQVNVEGTRLPEHRRIGFRQSMEAVGCGIVNLVCLGLYDRTSNILIRKKTTYQVWCYVDGAALVE